MNKHAMTAVAGVAGIAIGAGGWAVLGPAKTHTVTRTVAASAAPAAGGRPAARARYASAQAIADKLEASGFVVSMLHKGDVTSPDMGMDARYDFDITEKTGPAPGDSGINMFRNHDAVTTWVGLSQSFGGIAVVGDTWAVSLATDNAASVKLSKQMAPRIAKVLGGTVKE